MPGLHRQDRPRGSQVCCTHDVCRSAQVGADAHALEDRGSGDEVRDVRNAKIVRAGGHRGCAGLGESGGQEANVGRLV